MVWSKDGLASKVTESAMSVTRGVVDAQNSQRKAFMEHLRRAHASHAAAQQAWQRLIDTYTHEQGQCTLKQHLTNRLRLGFSRKNMHAEI